VIAEQALDEPEDPRGDLVVQRGERDLVALGNEFEQVLLARDGSLAHVVVLSRHDFQHVTSVSVCRLRARGLRSGPE
jgi:hypothetical protein